jgi:hypothetical protein
LRLTQANCDFVFLLHICSWLRKILTPSCQSPYGANHLKSRAFMPHIPL